MLFALSGGSRPVKPTYAKALDALQIQTTVLYPGTDLLPEDCAALLLTGGVDIHPVRFGLSPLPNGSEEFDLPRDDHEFRLFAHALARNLPVYGICRGMQVINIALGGDIWQDLPSQQGYAHSHSDGTPLWHEVHDADGQSLTTNSYHHQAVRRLGYGLQVAARCGDGTVEAIRHNRLPIAAVQWHPELMEDGMAYLLKMLSIVN